VTNTSADQADATATYPIILINLARVRCLVVGGGTVAERKVADLLDGGARPELISPALTETLATWKVTGQLTHIERLYRDGDLDGAFLVIAATDDPDANAAVAAEGARRGMLVNVADDPALGNFHTAATVRRGDLLLAVSTAGSSPALAARIRRELEARYGEEYAQLLNLLRRLRAARARELAPGQRAILWRRLVSDTLLGWLREGNLARAEAYARDQIAALQEEKRRQGAVEASRQAESTRL
jgi:precorrin-2 dehydrogenase / sirohydrochlorin ferrochelatase